MLIFTVNIYVNISPGAGPVIEQGGSITPRTTAGDPDYQILNRYAAMRHRIKLCDPVAVTESGKDCTFPDC